jgi:hypothetical protein
MLIVPGQNNERLNSGALVRLRRWLLACLMILAPLPSQADSANVDITHLRPHWSNGIYQLDTIISYTLSPEALEALESGVTLTFSVDIIISRARKYWWDVNVAVLEQQYQLRYHALSDQYIVSNLNSGAVNSFPTLRGALAVMGSIVDLPLIDDKLLDASLDYEGRLRASLDIDYLPTPLRLLAYVTSGWRLSSEWRTWTVTLNGN